MSDVRQHAEALYRTYGPIVYRRCLRLLRDREAARDATQEVFVKLLRDERALADREKAVPWIYRVATNHCLNLRRDARSRGQAAFVVPPGKRAMAISVTELTGVGKRFVHLLHALGLHSLAQRIVRSTRFSSE